MNESEVDLSKVVAILKPVFIKLSVCAAAVGFATLLYMLQKPNIYKASATIKPSSEETGRLPAFGLLTSLNLSVGPSRLEDLESLFSSSDLSVRVFSNHNLWQFVAPDSYDVKTGTFKIGWFRKLFGEKKRGKYPTDWDAIRAASDLLKIYVNKKTGTMTVTFESASAEASAKIVRYYLEEAKSRLQEEAFEQAKNNKMFIQEQIAKTLDPLTKERLYSLYGQETEREMMARNREHFGFVIIDSPRIPDRKSRPLRVVTSLILFFAALVTLCFGYVVYSSRPNKEVHKKE